MIFFHLINIHGMQKRKEFAYQIYLYGMYLLPGKGYASKPQYTYELRPLLHFSNLTFAQVCITLITIVYCHTTLNIVGRDVLSNITGMCISVGANAL